MYSYEQRAYIIRCNFCNQTEISHIPEVVAHFVDNGCSACQKRFNDNADRLLLTIDNLEDPGRALTDEHPSDN